MKHSVNFLKLLIAVVFSVFVFGSCTKEYHYTTVESEELNKPDSIIPLHTLVTEKPDKYISFADVDANYVSGDTMYVYLNRSGTEVRKYPVRFDGTYDDRIERLIFFKTFDGLVIGAGDSGSPVVTEDGEVVAILCYGFSYANQQFAARAIEDVLSVKSQMNLKNAVNTVFEPIKPVYQVIGMNSAQFERYSRHDSNDYFAKYSAINELSAPLMKSGSDLNQTTIIPGNSISLMEINGPIVKMGATGTISYISDNNIFGFGHDFSGGDAIGVPAYLSSMVTMIEAQSRAYKVSLPSNKMIGTLVGDDMNGILIDTSEAPLFFNIITNIKIADNSAVVDTHIVAQLADTYFEYYHTANLPPYLTYYYIYDNNYTDIYVEAVGSVVIEFEDEEGIEIEFVEKEIGYWVDSDIHSEIYYELYYSDHESHIKSVEYNVVITESEYDYYY